MPTAMLTVSLKTSSHKVNMGISRFIFSH